MTKALTLLENNPLLFTAFQELWQEEAGAELTGVQARHYGPGLLALVGAVARWKRSRGK